MGVGRAMLREFVTDNREEIITRCRSKAATRSGLPRRPRAGIDHGVPTFLDELVDELRLKRLPNPEIRKTATKHGHDLMHQGLTVSQVVHEYGDVCQSITEMAVERHASISLGEFRMLNRALDDAIAAAVTQYANERDRSIQGQTADETERLAKLTHRLRNSIHIARGALEAIKAGRAGIAGSTGTVLDQSLLEANDIIERVVATDVFASFRHHTVGAKAQRLTSHPRTNRTVP